MPDTRPHRASVELEAIVRDLIAWLPDAGDSHPQIRREHRVRKPAGGVHDHWHRSSDCIEAPQTIPVVFDGQSSSGRGDGPVLPRTEIL